MATILAELEQAVTANEKQDAVISIQDVHRIYQLGENRVHALRGINLEIGRGEFVAIMGASGSGKSTLMNILGCLDRPTSGNYVLDGVNVAQLPKKELAAIRNRRLGFVFQGFNLLARTTALENVELPTLYARLDVEERQKRARRALEMVGLGERLDHFPSQLSGGQQQRVAIARALVNQPSILLADEPTGNLDGATGKQVIDLLFRLHRDSGSTFLLITHDPELARRCDRIVTLIDGAIDGAAA
jgi:putative ABC transport system ATP-binding protein